jgi:hypothetical protein
VTFGNTAEFILTLFALVAGMSDVVKATITDSIRYLIGKRFLSPAFRRPLSRGAEWITSTPQPPEGGTENLFVNEYLSPNVPQRQPDAETGFRPVY